jgi:hypothetical protein
MDRRSCVLGLLASFSGGVAVSLAASVDAAAAKADTTRPGIDELEEFSGRRRRFGFRRRRRRFARRRGGRGGGGGGDDAPDTSVGLSSGGGGRGGSSDSILSTRKPVPLSDQPAPAARPARP